MGSLALILIALGFVGLLYALAALVERHRHRVATDPIRRHAYALSLAVYCSSWTFYGAVGTAALDGWSYLPIYLGPALVLLFAPRLLERLVRAAQADGASAISDFIGSRFSKSRGVAALVTLTAVLGITPYIALQLRSVGSAYAILSGGGSAGAAMATTAGVLALFALLFGARRYEAAGRNEGLVFATALESLVKLAAFVAVAALAVALMARAPDAVAQVGLVRLRDAFAPSRLGLEQIVITVLSMSAILCLPRQFYMGVIEARGPTDLRRARWRVAIYLMVMSAAVVPIALAGLTFVPPNAPADQFVLMLPIAVGSPVLTAAAFIGGFSAATAMVVVESVALATMVSNDLIAPVLLRSPRLSGEAQLGHVLMGVRRVSIVLVIAAALFWGLNVRTDERLASIGLIAFAALIQLAPYLLLAVRGAGQDALAAKAGLIGGLALWLFTLALPPVLPGAWMAALSGGAFDPHKLLGIGNAPPLVHGVAWSLGANLALFGLVGTLRRTARAPRILKPSNRIGVVSDLAELSAFVARFVGEPRVAELFPERAPGRRIERADARRAERAIAAVVGAASAHALMASALAGTRLSHEDVARMLDEGGQSLQFSKGLLAATLENIDPGVSVIDGDQRLIAWNSRYMELFAYPEGMVHVGRPIADLIRFNAERGECGPGEIEAHVERRLMHLRRGVPHSFERIRPDGRVIKTVGGPMPGGGYVMCFTDITAEAQARAELERARAALESRVAERTAELTRLNAELAAATRDKTRFLAAASHDLLQPLHAARLFCTALDRQLDPRGRVLLGRIDRSIDAANELLRALLDISKLDAGGVVPRPEPLRLRPLLAEVVEGFRPLADEKGLALRLGPGDGVVETDPVLLRSIVQNFVSNAVRYTERGGILVGIRRREGRMAVEVFDTGVGIAPEQQAIIFREFERLGNTGESGIGLGLAIVERTAALLGAGVTLRSVPGRGSAFGVRLPASPAEPAAPPARLARALGTGMVPRRVLVVDDDPDIVDATVAALRAAGHEPLPAPSPAAALATVGDAEIALVDFHLGAAIDGIELIGRLRVRNRALRAALVTADTAPATLARAAAAGIPVFAKPIPADALASFLAEAAVGAA